jgi:hypothetical protein
MLRYAILLVAIAVLRGCGPADRSRSSTPERPQPDALAVRPFIGIWAAEDGSTCFFRSDGVYARTAPAGAMDRGHWSESGGFIALHPAHPPTRSTELRWRVEQGEFLVLTPTVGGPASEEMTYRRRPLQDGGRPNSPREWPGRLPAGGRR